MSGREELRQVQGLPTLPACTGVPWVGFGDHLLIYPFPGAPLLPGQVAWALLHAARGILPRSVARPQGTQWEEGLSLGSGNTLLGTVPKKRVSHPAGSHSQPNLHVYTQRTRSFNTSFPLTNSPATLVAYDCSYLDVELEAFKYTL